VVQAEAIAKMVSGLKHVVLWRGLIDLRRDIPISNIDLLVTRNRLLVRNDLHPYLQYLLLEAMIGTFLGMHDGAKGSGGPRGDRNG
jgi:hypothetical protein